MLLRIALVEIKRRCIFISAPPSSQTVSPSRLSRSSLHHSAVRSPRQLPHGAAGRPRGRRGAVRDLGPALHRLSRRHLQAAAEQRGAHLQGNADHTPGRANPVRDRKEITPFTRGYDDAHFVFTFVTHCSPTLTLSRTRPVFKNSYADLSPRPPFL